uniref:Uncharacterized protein n=1 Tax=Amphimedon queenslandica TaxID=400682 RepID=A0A1X7V9P0_AMPQE
MSDSEDNGVERKSVNNKNGADKNDAHKHDTTNGGARKTSNDRMIAKCATKGIAREEAKVIVKALSKLYFIVLQESTWHLKEKKKLQHKSLGKGAACTGIGLAADVAQAGLEHYGYKEAEKVVGASGNVASGAIYGAALGGPVGAGVSALVGFGLWGAGEIVFMLFEQ